VPALPAVEDGSSSNTKARLSNILNSFQDFDQSMKVGVRQRKEKDEHRVAQLTTELTRLEKLLNVEIKRRVELNKSIQTWAESEIDKVTGTFKEMIADRSQAIHSRMEQVVAKIDGLEQRFASEMAKIPIDITQRAEHLTAMLVRYVRSMIAYNHQQALLSVLLAY
jgi:SF-assemblin/beta giardin